MDESAYTELMTTIAQGFEIVAAVTMIVGLVFAVVLSLTTWRRSRDGEAAYRALRQSFGGAILLGLEILVAGDLIRTVAISPTLDNVLVLGLIVLIRTFLSFSLEIEIDGVPPWRRGLQSGAGVIARATSTARSAGE